MMKRIICIFYITFFCQACGGLGITIPTQTPVIRSAWLDKWLHDPTCEPPCWEGIVPEKTTEDDALIIIRQLPGVVIDTNDFLQQKYNKISWKIINNKSGGYLFIDSQSRIITYIFFDLRNNHLELQEVIERYGQPTHIVVKECNHGRGCEMNIVFVNQGIALLLSTPFKHKNDKFSFTINPKEEIFWIRLINSKELSSQVIKKEIWVFAWNGYVKYTGDW